MAYTNRADIYLGDVSSQVYEFLRRPRPCVFLNPHGFDAAHDPNFAHWQAGPVVPGVDGLGEALRMARDRHASFYQPIQQRMMDYSFDLTDEPSADRAARVVAGLAGVSFAPRGGGGALVPDKAVGTIAPN
jgi:hypothetical protein